MSSRQTLPNRRESITHKIRVGGKRTIYMTTDTASPPRELFIRVRGDDCTAETIALYDALARVVSLSLQYGAPVEIVSKMLCGSKVEPCGIVVGHRSIHFCSSLPDLVGQYLLSLAHDPSTTPPA